MGPFADRYAPVMTDLELDRFERLLEEADHDIYAWIVAAAPVPAAFDDDLMIQLREFRPAETDLAAKGG